MNDAHEGDLVTLRARSLALRLADDPDVRYTVERGDALRLVGRHPDGQVEVDYLQRRWLASGEALQPLARVIDTVTVRPPGLPAPPPIEGPPGDRAGASIAADGPAPIGEPAPAPLQLRVGVGWRLVLIGAALVVVVALALLVVRFLRLDEESLPSVSSAPIAVDGRVTTPAAAPTVPIVPAAPAGATPRVTTTPRVTMTASMTVTPPMVSNLVVCDTTVDCGIAGGEFSPDEVLACLRVTPGGSRGPLVLVATLEDSPPAGAQSAAVRARSDPVPQDPAFRCHPVRSTAGDLAAGRYWLWALDGMTVLGRTSFVVGPP